MDTGLNKNGKGITLTLITQLFNNVASFIRLFLTKLIAHRF
ncbi:hypothetical protein BN1182_AS_00250 [Pantoea ananatis]|nr:hypothetical protein BN1182_AS_00250 [Pantoea ananatis]